MQMEIGACFESFNDALQHAVTALGGYKKVGPSLRPELPIEQAAQWLRDCLAAGRREKLSPEQVILLVKTARDAGVHAPMEFFALSTGYKATAVDPESQRQQLQEVIAAGVEQLNRQMATLQRLTEARS